mmetsp:Transcript_35568/g.69663  ORF Transcript_35568/g.69663 Transcript_35568/m.69663 type:complete len:333 (-) Transcript_35568:55-1053(-)
MQRPQQSKATPKTPPIATAAKKPLRKGKRTGSSAVSVVYVCASAVLLLILYFAYESEQGLEAGQEGSARRRREPVLSNIERTGATRRIVELQKERENRGMGGGQDPLLGYKVIAQLHHDSGAFTQGLEFVSGRFIESTGIASTLREVEIMSGEPIRRVDLTRDLFGEGCTVLKGMIYQLTWRSYVCLVYDMETFTEVKRFRYKTPGWGLCNDGESLIMSDGSDVVVYRDAKTFEVTRSLNVTDNGKPLYKVNELEYVHGEIWANIWFKDSIARISPKDGSVIGWIDLAGLHPHRSKSARNEDVLNGIAWDKDRDRLWVTGKLWPSVFEIEVA